ncbi:adenylate/guanylate cyclase domain-containing protein [Prosthecochloris sp. N3]|uniref:Adenylate/guanylate cyclase domain-containing protein n=1 Tax=Prosthecochloris ethylica TaxID=2743976 RepID=A0ABR9XPF0_9CHLB|nr:adenylate/guanylate cyclase domain-containing protein [Prosthecochloris ethylica]MBF0586149.1 adenylate/guanylate cyclase domain-containing protein [Prosthecochloris ethylica]MBF0635855.1 adenylate/guanylate cyclase domain-containing protein [Prosthecochloris ethylica]NUK47470.1 adenylate/guanylate cyclase domain-containing protein [Prosthecochloris ethylica]
MRLSPHIQRQVFYVLWIVAGFLSAFYIYLFFFGVISNVLGAGPLFTGRPVLLRFTLAGIVVGVSVGVLNVFVLPGLLKNMNFLLTLFVGTMFDVALSLVALFCVVLAEEYIMLFERPELFSVPDRLKSFFFAEFYVLLFYLPLVSLVVNYMGLLIQRIGERTFWNAVKGTYHTPHEEERVFMFLDLYGSTAIAQRLGHREYHDLLHEVFNDISCPVSTYRGEVYQYVGDSVVITWNMHEGTRQMNCIRCYFEIAERLALSRHLYEERYGVVPHFKAGLHAGKVTAGEVGEDKREIVFHGDTVNTAARIEDECSELDEAILLSEELLFLFPVRLLKNYTTRYKGSITLRGRFTPISLYSISPKNSVVSREWEACSRCPGERC